MREANRNLEAAYDDLTDSIAQNGTTLDTTTEAGRANEAALDAIAQRALEAAASTLEQTGSQEEANAVLQAGRDRLIEMLGQFGITGQAAQDYVDNLELIPGNISTAVEVTGMDSATEKAYALRTALLTVAAAARKASQNIASGNSGGGGSGMANGGVVDYYAWGGFSENHIAQIAPAGAWRVWAEPETGGEAYIPLAPAKRDRSVDIWEETGRRLGVLSYADGAIAARQGYAAPNYAAASQVVAGQQPLVGSLTLQSTGDIRSDLDEVGHELRRLRRGGR